MSNAHRPTWNPAMGRETKGGSRQYSDKDMASHTKLKFRQPGQTSTAEVTSADLRRELLIAERKAQDKKRKTMGLGPLPPLLLDGVAIVDGEAKGEEGGDAKRRKMLESVVGLDRDDDDDDEEEGDSTKNAADAKGKGKAKDDDDDSDSSNSDSDSDSDEDDTAELLRELEKIKRERAEEKARIEALAAEADQVDREHEIATGNPLLNLAAALGQSSGESEAGTSSSFKVGRRWDDDVIFKNQAAGTEDKNKKKEFVNDLLRSEFHRKFMGKFIK